MLNEAFARAVLDERCNELIEQVNDGSSFSCAPDVVVVAERIEGHRWHVPLLPAGNEEVQLRLQHLPGHCDCVENPTVSGGSRLPLACVVGGSVLYLYPCMYIHSFDTVCTWVGVLWVHSKTRRRSGRLTRWTRRRRR